MNTKTLKEQRGNVVKQIHDLVTKVQAEKRSLSADEMQQFDRMDQEQERLGAEVESESRIEKFQGLSLQESREQIRPNRVERYWTNQTELRQNAFKGWLTKGSSGFKDHYADAATQLGTGLEGNVHKLPMLKRQPKSVKDLEKLKDELRAQTVGTPTAGGDLVAVDNELMYEVERALLYYSGMLEVARVIRTETGANLPHPTTNDTGNIGSIVGETNAITEQDETFGQVILNAYKLTSGLVQISWELLSDSAISIDAFIGESLGIRLGRAVNRYLTVGTGAGGTPAQPRGFLLDAPSGGTSATTGGTTFVYADLVNLYHSVDVAYWPNARYMFNSGTMKALKLLVDNSGRPLWQPGLEGFAPGPEPLILGKPYTLNNDMPNAGPGTTPIAFGDFSKFIVRIVAGGNTDSFELIRLNERYAEIGVVAFLAFMRVDSRLVDAGTGPLKVLTMHA